MSEQRPSKTLVEALAEWDRWQVPASGNDHGVPFNVVLTNRGHAIEGLIDAARAAVAERHKNDRVNYETTEDGFRICRGYHHRSADCEWLYYVPRPSEPLGNARTLLERAEELFQDECDPVLEPDSYAWLQDVREHLRPPATKSDAPSASDTINQFARNIIHDLNRRDESVIDAAQSDETRAVHVYGHKPSCALLVRDGDCDCM